MCHRICFTCSAHSEGDRVHGREVVWATAKTGPPWIWTWVIEQSYFVYPWSTTQGYTLDRIKYLSSAGHLRGLIHTQTPCENAMPIGDNLFGQLPVDKQNRWHTCVTMRSWSPISRRESAWIDWSLWCTTESLPFRVCTEVPHKNEIAAVFFSGNLNVDPVW